MSTGGPDLLFEDVLSYVKSTHNLDFTGYKRASLKRRILKRMGAVGVTEFSEYQAYLEAHPNEVVPLLNTILINVTSFFRDESSWTYLAERVVPRILEGKVEGKPLRIWSAGCASGQEPYSIAILMAEAVGISRFSASVKIYATDVDEAALAEARRASYEEGEVQSIPSHLREKYFVLEQGRHVIDGALRRSVIFGRHDLVQDAPIPSLDLLSCRNTLMYFEGATQEQILRRFHFSLLPTGFLFLGRAEMLLSQSALFRPVETQHRVFCKAPLDALADAERVAVRCLTGRNQNTLQPRLAEAALDSAPVAQVVIDWKGIVRIFNKEARLLFGLGPHDLGKPLQDLQLSYQPMDLRSMIDQVRAEQRPAKRTSIEWKPPNGDPLRLDLLVTSLEEGGKPAGVTITFTDVTHHHRLLEELQKANENLQTSYEELQASNEELETTNEELQASNEELETTNEELQAANEEMETMNEELHSTNDEIRAVNDRLQERTAELDNANGFLQSILESFHVGLLVLDRDLRLLAWNREASELWGLRTDEALGKALLDLDIGFPVQELRTLAGDCLAGREEFRRAYLQAVNRRGRSFTCRVTVTPLRSKDPERHGAILLMENWEGEQRP